MLDQDVELVAVVMVLLDQCCLDTKVSTVGSVNPMLSPAFRQEPRITVEESESSHQN